MSRSVAGIETAEPASLFALLQPVADRLQQVRGNQRLAAVWFGTAVCALATWGFGWAFGAAVGGIWVWLLAAIVATGCVAVWPRTKLAPIDVARQIEQAFPDLDSRLITSLQAPEVAGALASSVTTSPPLLRQLVVAETLSHGARCDWRTVVPDAMLTQVRRLRIASLAFLIAAIALHGLPSRAGGQGGGASQAALLSNGTGATADVLALEIEPGDVEIERGTSLLVLARFGLPSGSEQTNIPPSAVPQTVELVWLPEGGAEQRQVLSKSLDDPLFGGRLTNVASSGEYYVVADGRPSPRHRLTVYDLPAVEQAQLIIRPPAYTNRPETTLDRAFDITLVEGSEIELRLRLNKTVAVTRLDGAPAPRTMSPLANDSTWVTASWTPTGARETWTLVLEDQQGRRNRDETKLRIEIVPNRTPDLKITFPAQDTQVTLLEELVIEGTAWDDFGLLEVGLEVTVPGQSPKTIEFGRDWPGSKLQSLKTMLPLEEWGVRIGDALAYHLYADDYGPDGNRRRTFSDLFFAEIRPFSETYREVQAQGGPGAQGAQTPTGNQLEELIQQQKMILSATWNLQRSGASRGGALPEKTAPATAGSNPPGKSPTPPRSNPRANKPVPGGAAGDKSDRGLESLSLITQAQAQVREGLEGLIDKMETPAAIALLRDTVEQMRTVEHELDFSQKQSRNLVRALQAEQAAFSGLLKLRGHDHKVMKGQQSGAGSGGSSSMSEQQLDQLELSSEENRYQSREQASRPQDSDGKREQLALFERLKDLARRQQGITDRLKELEAAARLAKTPEQQAEIERQLKRLRDEQQQLLQDADEAQQKLAQAADQSQLAEARQRLEQTRSQLVDAAENLRQGQVAQALSSSTRAQRDLHELQDDFRRQTAARFADSLRGLKESARALTEKEQQLAEQLQQQQRSETKSLRQSRERQALEEAFRDQRQRLGQVLDQARELVQETESAEPLISKQLYDTLRQTQERQVDPALESTSKLLHQGLVQEAGQAEAQARQGLEQLQQGIRHAAEALLGDEVETLKRARRELRELTDAVEQELTRGQDSSTPGKATPGEEGSGQGSQSSSGRGDQKQSPGNGASKASGNGESPSNEPGTGGKSQSGPGEASEAGGEGTAASEDGSMGPDGDSASDAADGSGSGGRPREGRKPPAGLRRPPKGSGASRGAPPGESQGGFGGGPGSQGGGPLTGDQFTEWMDKLRDVETLVTDPRLLAEVSKVREQARSLRADFRRHSVTPNWELVKSEVYQPLVEVQRQVAEELARHESEEALVPVDRDPVPSQYRDLVRGYYEQLGDDPAAAKSPPPAKKRERTR